MLPTPKHNKTDEVYNSVSIKVKTPEGTLFVDVLDDKNGKPFKVLARIGKSGSSLSAYVDAVAALISTVIKDHGVDAAIQMLYMIRSDKSVVTGKIGSSVVYVHSGPEGFAHALNIYARYKYAQLEKALGIEDNEDNYRIPLKRRK